MKTSRIHETGVFARQKQQGVPTILPNRSVEARHLTTGLLTALMLADAIVGSASDVANGLATHTSFQQAHDDLTAGKTILLLRVTNVENLTLSKRFNVRGLGYDSQLNGNITVQGTCDYSSWAGLRFGGVVTHQAGADGNLYSGCFFANDPQATDSGTGNYFDGVIE